MEIVADKIIAFNHQLEYHGKLPHGFRVVNPFVENPETMPVMEAFYRKYYNDPNRRRFIIGINPGRHGAGVTGIPFTDTKRLESVCGIKMESAHTHEISSVFIYDLIEAYGGADSFYSRFYINSPFPLAITRETKNGQWLNANYYDDRALFNAVKPFMIESLQKQIDIGLDTSRVYILGKKNALFIRGLNKEAKLFDQMVELEHPRYIQQYQSKEQAAYIDKYLKALKG
ncbi:MAG: SMUG2 DNA glycosylase family protein [Bacteroidota bacterium]|nr:SMUG2 DNA glycosylase family protein [Bacteroidota bacterium]